MVQSSRRRLIEASVALAGGAAIGIKGANGANSANGADPAVDLKIHVHQAPASGLLVNSFLLETRRGIVIIDAQLMLSEATKIVQTVKEIGKPLGAIIVTHPHPDHYKGLVVLLDAFPGTPVYATRATIIGMYKLEHTTHRSDGTGLAVPIPDHALPAHGEVELGGIRIVVDEQEHNEAENLSVLYLPEQRVLFASDLLHNGCHPSLQFGASRGWVETIDNIKQRYLEARIVYAGHGDAGDLDSLSDQRNYLKEFQLAVKKRLPRSEIMLTPAEKFMIAHGIKARYPMFELETLLDKNIEAIARELRQ
jgi:glyoxylase-like metal-dependent hydrolase (beta-lactamase superfamily II)